MKVERPTDPWAVFRTPLPNDRLEQLAALVRRQAAAEALVADATKMLKEAQAQLDRVSKLDLPDLLDELEMVGHPGVAGHAVSLEDKWHFSVPSRNAQRAAQWFIEHDLGGAVEHTVQARFSIDEDEKAEKALEALKQAGVEDLADMLSIHSSRRDALLRDLIERKGAEAVPLDLFGGHLRRQVKLTKLKK